jgi:hypothetical protein
MEHVLLSNHHSFVSSTLGYSLGGCNQGIYVGRWSDTESEMEERFHWYPNLSWCLSRTEEELGSMED